MMFRHIALMGAFSLFLASANSQQPYVIDQILGIVGSKPIKLSEVETEYYQQKAMGNSGLVDLKCEIFENLLGQKLLINQAILDSVKVSDAQVESELSHSISNAVAQLGSVEKVEEHYNKSVRDIKDELRDQYRDLQLARTLQSQIVDEIKITPSEITDFYNKLPKDSLPMINTQVELAQIAMYPAYSEEAILLAKERLLEIRKEILAGKKFQALAYMYSEDENSAKKGGEIGFVNKADVDPEYAKAAFGLKKPGEISRIVESQYGYHLIQLIERKGDRVNTRHILIKAKPDPNAVKKTMQTLDSVALFIRRDSVKFDKAVAFYSMDKETRNNDGMLSNPYGGFRFDYEQQLSPKDFSIIKTLKVGELSNSYDSRDKNGKLYYKIIKLVAVIPAHRANLKDDYYLVQEMAKNDKKAKVMEDWFTEKQRTSFITIDKSFQRCAFRSKGWSRE